MIKIVSTLLAVASTISASAPIASGRWLVTNQMEEAIFDGRRENGPLPKAKPQSICLEPTAAARGPGLALSDPSLCKVISSTIKDGAFAFETECKATESNDTISTKAAGNYSTNSYTGTSTSMQRRDGMRIEMRSRMEAERIGDC